MYIYRHVEENPHLKLTTLEQEAAELYSRKPIWICLACRYVAPCSQSLLNRGLPLSSFFLTFSMHQKASQGSGEEKLGFVCVT